MFNIRYMVEYPYFMIFLGVITDIIKYVLYLKTLFRERRFLKMEKNYLKIGIMTNEELAHWFGVTLGTYKNSAKKYLEKLQKYADFERVRGGANIIEIHFKQYIKNYNFNDGDYFNKEIERCTKEQNGLASIAGIARKAQKEVEEFNNLSNIQIQRRFSEVALVHYGDYNDMIGGFTGVRERDWAIKIDDYNHYRALTEDEYNLFIEIAGGFYTKDAEKLIKKKKLEEQLKDGEIDVDTYFDKVELYELDNFSDILLEFKARTGCQIVLASKYMIKAWNEEKAKEIDEFFN